MTVFATGGTETGRLLLIEQGADAVFNHHELGYLDRIFEKSGGHGVHVILEMLANINLGNDLSILARGGRVAVIGSRGPVEINPRDLMLREADVRGVMLNPSDRAEVELIHRTIRAGLERGLLRPIVERQLPLGSAADAHERVLSPGAHGKIVLVL
jgi:NADPH2:quinone reductase